MTHKQGKQGCRWFKVHRTSSNLLEPHIYTGETRCRVLMHLFRVVQEHRTSSNHIMTEIAGRVEFIHMSSGWFDCTEPSLTTSLQGKQSVQGAHALVRGGSSVSDLLEPSRTTSSQRYCSKVCSVLPHEFGVVRLYRTFSNNIFPGARTFSNHIIAEIARCVEFFHMRSGYRTFSNYTGLSLLITYVVLGLD